MKKEAKKSKLSSVKARKENKPPNHQIKKQITKKKTQTKAPKQTKPQSKKQPIPPPIQSVPKPQIEAPRPISKKPFKIKHLFKNEYIEETHELITKKKKIFRKTLALDALFLLILAITLRGALRFIPNANSNLYKVFGIPLVFSMSIILFIMLTFIYSIIKYKLLYMIESLLENVKFSLERFDKFFVLNTIILGTSFLLFVGIYTIAFFLWPVLKWAAWVTFVFLSGILYTFMTISHWLFVHNPNPLKAIGDTITIMKEKTENYKVLVGDMVLIIGTYTLISLIALTFLNNNENIVLIKTTLITVGIILVYLTTAYNRICFYFAVEELKHQTKV